MNAKYSIDPLDCWDAPALGMRRRVAAVERQALKHELCCKLSRSRQRRYGEALDDLFAANYAGVGFGVKISQGEPAGSRCIRVYVARKLPLSRLPRSRRIPKFVNGLPTDVIVMADARPMAVFCGTTVGLRAATAGTIGCVVTKAGKRYVLSNNHVLADCNVAPINAPILIPPGGFARLADFEPLVFKPDGVNLMDAAIAELTVPSLVNPEIAPLGPITPTPVVASPTTKVKKSGIGSQVTHGRVEAYDEDIPFPYPGGTAVFRAQLAVKGVPGRFATGGDSGSLVVTEDLRPVGLLFAASASLGLTFATPIARVLDRFKVSLVI